jgi:RNase_H superfamily
MDMEGVPDRGRYYLIGLLVCQADTMEHYAFWADTDHEEGHMWQQCMEKVQHSPEAPIYHYGSYELRAVVTLAKRYHTDAESMRKRLVQYPSLPLRESLLSHALARIEGDRPLPRSTVERAAGVWLAKSGVAASVGAYPGRDLSRPPGDL